MEQYKNKLKVKKCVLQLLLFLSFSFIIILGEMGRLNLLADGRDISALAN